jgi:GNAT superfamily N-acetyltransferase
MIRRVRPEERERLLEIEREAGRAFAGIGMEEIARDDPGTVEDVAGAWVAVDEADRPVAYLVATVVDGNAHVGQVSVAPSHARRGLGAALIDHLVATAGRPALTLTTFRDVAWNAPYYERLGFRVLDPADHGPELAALVRAEAERIPGDTPRVAMRREIVVTPP